MTFNRLMFSVTNLAWLVVTLLWLFDLRGIEDVMYVLLLVLFFRLGVIEEGLR